MNMINEVETRKIYSAS